jgi:hypothetical protein
MMDIKNGGYQRPLPTMVGVAVRKERFYKPNLDAAHTLAVQAIMPRPADLAIGVLIPLPGITINRDFLT